MVDYASFENITAKYLSDNNNDFYQFMLNTGQKTLMENPNKHSLCIPYNDDDYHKNGFDFTFSKKKPTLESEFQYHTINFTDDQYKYLTGKISTVICSSKKHGLETRLNRIGIKWRIA